MEFHFVCASHRDVVVIGGGPAGLTCAHELLRLSDDSDTIDRFRSVLVVEADPVHVGGISRTIDWNGYRFDVGGHRFYSKSASINAFWKEMLGDDLLERSRSSMIFHRGKFYPYPLDLFVTLKNLGFFESCLCLLSYVHARMRPVRSVISFEDWVVNAFGRRLYDKFFRTYTEKVWGRSGREISADWASQRIRGFDFKQAVLHALKRFFSVTSSAHRTLLDKFWYPRLGPGQMWDAVARDIESRRDEFGKSRASVALGTRVTSLKKDGELWILTTNNKEFSEIHCSHVVSTMPLLEFSRIANCCDPIFESLEYRDFILVALMFEGEAPFEDNWVYVHDSRCVTGRVQNFGSWSPSLLPSNGTCCLGFEYFCSDIDDLWNSSDEALGELAISDLKKLWDVGSKQIAFHVVRQRKAYPVYSRDHVVAIEKIRQRLNDEYPGIVFAGRNGLHRYGNQDHAMSSGMQAARRVVFGDSVLDPWDHDDDSEYFESGVSL